MLVLCHCKAENLLLKRVEKVCFLGRDYVQVFIDACFKCKPAMAPNAKACILISLCVCVQDYGDDVEIDGFDIDYGVREIN